MLLNEFLSCRLGAEYEDKFNYLAIKEVLNNPLEYPAIYDYIADMVDYDENDKVIDKEYDSGFFDCDDFVCAGAKETFELNVAFVRAFGNYLLNNKDKEPLVSATYGFHYLLYPDFTAILYPYLNHAGLREITINKNETVISENLFYPKRIDNQFVGHSKGEVKLYNYYQDNIEVLKTLKERFLTSAEIDCWCENRFDKRDLEENCEKFNDELTGYSFIYYEFQFKNNLVKLYTTEIGFDALSLVRLPITDSLTDEQKNNEIARSIV